MHWACKRGDENLVKLLGGVARHVVNERSVSSTAYQEVDLTIIIIILRKPNFEYNLQLIIISVSPIQ